MFMGKGVVICHQDDRDRAHPGYMMVATLLTEKEEFTILMAWSKLAELMVWMELSMWR